MRFKLFVYGTLKKGFYNHFYLKNAKYLGKAKTLHPYPLIAPKRYYPYLVDKKGKGKIVKGELYEVDIATLKRIDRLEEAPRYYKRDFIQIIDEKGKKHKAYTYFVAFFLPYWEFAFLEEFLSPKK